MHSPLKNLQPVQYGVKSALKRLFLQIARKPLASIVTLMCLVALTGGVAQAEEPLRDPTRPYTAAERARTAAPRFVVNAIIVSPERRVAIVNGRRVAVGGSIGGANVVAIEKDQLILELGGKRITATLNEGASR